MKLRVLLIVELDEDSPIVPADERVEEQLEEVLKEYFHDIDDIEVGRVRVEGFMSNLLPTDYQSFIHKSRYARWLDERRPS